VISNAAPHCLRLRCPPLCFRAKVFPHSADESTDCPGQNATDPPSPEKAEPLEPQNQPATGPVENVREERRKPRFKFAVDIAIHSKSCGLLRGRTLDISEIGIAVVLDEDVPVGEVVKLNIPLASGPMTICATVRHRGSFFRYGFEFTESNSVREILESACRQLAIQQSGSGRP
jgi:hypothetical protein